ncbi:hypothetical protein NQ315_016238 [Exocentrus adspersus]|uniref:YqaJ viral recombinase domain-containing protein n=1 Tax=Exocentrus adspersus TaxID=1586481 RepID=A0AAV8VJ08_9CUCU|nr:hypothetical protein NQ315_016238 [Exocentrus adspersus]
MLEALSQSGVVFGFSTPTWSVSVLAMPVLPEQDAETEFFLWIPGRANGALTESIMGACKHLDTSSVSRGKMLEPVILKRVSNLRHININKVGLFINKNFPILGAAPDGMTNDYCIEVKCPSLEKTIENYKRNGLQTQMFFTNKQKGLFCIATPHFEEDNKVDIREVQFDKNQTREIVDLAMEFWKTNIFPILMKISSMSGVLKSEKKMDSQKTIFMRVLGTLKNPFLKLHSTIYIVNNGAICLKPLSAIISQSLTCSKKLLATTILLSVIRPPKPPDIKFINPLGVPLISFLFSGKFSYSIWLRFSSSDTFVIEVNEDAL